jgi:hypothetical protein
VLVLRGRGDGTLHDPVRSALPEDFPNRPTHVGLATRDLDGDGLLDAVLTMELRVTLAPNEGDATFAYLDTTTETPLGLICNPVVEDFDGDGSLDVATTPCRSGEQGVVLYPIVESVPQEPRVIPLQSDGRSFALAGGDFDADGLADLAALSLPDGGGHADVWILLAPDLEPAALSIAEGWNSLPLDLLVADVDGDAALDLVAHARVNAAALLGDGAGGFMVAGAVDLWGSCSGESKAAMADLDRDGLPDLVNSVVGANDIECWQTANLFWARNLGAGEFGEHEEAGTEGSNDLLVAGDLDGDGFEELVAVAYGDVGVIMRGPDGDLGTHWTEEVCGPGLDGSCLRAATLADVDADSNLDLVLAGWTAVE